MASQIFDCYEDAEAFIAAYENETTSAFSTWHRRNSGTESLSSVHGHRIWWEDKRGEVPVSFDGVPFVTIQTEVRYCHQGPNKERGNRPVATDCTDHYYKSSKKRIQPSKKVGCPVQIRMRMVIVFPEYKVKINGPATEWKKRKIAANLRQNFSSTTTHQQFRVIMKIIGSHEGHLVGELSGTGLPVNADVRKKIKSLVEDGITNPSQIKIYLKHVCDDDVADTNRRCHPTLRDIRNHVQQTLKRKCFSEDDQENLLVMVNKWKEDLPDDNIFFRPAGEENKMLFLYQSQFQRELLLRYGSEMVLMDSTYQTTKYEIPLFFLCISTNVGYTMIGYFLLNREDVSSISEALEILKSWNPGWRPRSFIVDNDKAEIASISGIFPGAEVFLCDFHREQAWLRWFNKSENNAEGHKESVLKQLRMIAQSNTETEYENEVQKLKSTDFFKESNLFRNWIERHWLQMKERWVYCFRKSTINIQVSTTNGVESLHKRLKYQYLKNFNSGSTLSGLAKVLTERFVPDSQKLYIQNNIGGLGLFRRYSPDIPSFLIDRPKKFVAHSLKRISSGQEIQKEKILKTDSGYKVPSTTSDEIHDVCLATEIPSCTCKDWRRFHWPCKHMMTIFEQFPESGWNSLSSTYRLLPWFNLDQKVFQGCPTSLATGVNNLKSGNEDMESTEDVNTEKRHEEETESSSVKKLRNSCLMMIKNIQTGVYCIEERDILLQVRDILKIADNRLQEKMPRLRGLPLRGTLKRHRRRRYLYKRNLQKKRKGGPKAAFRYILKVLDCPNIIAPEVLPIDIYVDIQSAETDDPYLEVLKNIWSEPENDELIVRVGPHNVTRRSLHYLRTTLSDDIIDASLSLLLHGRRDVLHIDSITTTAIFNGQENIHHNMYRENINDYETCIGAVNEGGCHWILMVISPVTKSIIYINPLGENVINCQTYINYWYEFLNARYKNGLETDVPGNWTFYTVPHSKQLDSVSCGVYVIKLAECYITHQSMTLNWTPEDITRERLKIGRRLLSEGMKILTEGIPSPERPEIDEIETVVIEETSKNERMYMTDKKMHSYKLRKNRKKAERSSFIYPKTIGQQVYCVCKKRDDGSLYWQCETCLTWYHPSCIGMDIEPEHFICCFCIVINEEVTDEESIEIVTGTHEEFDKIDESFFELNSSAVHSFIKEILECDIETSECDETSHGRHHAFILDWNAYLKTERQKYMYGSKYFKAEMVELILDNLREKYLIFLLDPVRPATAARIIFLKGIPENSKLAALLKAGKLLSPKYLTQVLLKEVLTFLVTLKTGIPLEAAEKINSSTEVTKKTF